MDKDKDRSPLDKLREEMQEQDRRDQRRADEEDRWYKAQAVKRESEARRSS